MKNVFLSNCLIIYIENEVAKKISLDSIIIDFESMKNIEQNFIDLEFIYEIKVFYVIFNLSSPKFFFFLADWPCLMGPKMPLTISNGET